MASVSLYVNVVVECIMVCWQFGMFEVLVSSVVDQFPALLRRYKVFVLLALCVLQFLLGLPLVSQVSYSHCFIIFNYT